MGKMKSFLLTSPENYMAHLGPHCEVASRERAAWGSAFSGVEGGA